MGGPERRGTTHVMAACWFVDGGGSAGYTLYADAEYPAERRRVKLARGPMVYLEAIAKEHNEARARRSLVEGPNRQFVRHILEQTEDAPGKTPGVERHG